MSTGVTAMSRRGRSSSHSTQATANSSSPRTTWSPASRWANRVAGDRGHARRGHHAVLCPFEAGNLLLEGPVGRVAGARVEVRGRVPLERPVDRVLLLGGGVEGEGRCRVDRRVVRMGGRVGPLPRGGIARVAKPSPSVRSRMPSSSWCRGGPARGKSRVASGPATRARRRALPPMDRSDWWTTLSSIAAAALAETWIHPSACPGSRATRSTGGRPSSTITLARTAGDRPHRSRPGGSVRRGDPRVRGGLSPLPPRPASPRPVPAEDAAAMSTTIVWKASTTSSTTSRTPCRTTTRTSPSGA